MRDALIIPLNETENIIITTDNSGAIGMRTDDVVKVPYDIVAYFSFRVAVMECMAAGGEPFSVVINNFCPEESWGEMKAGVQKGVAELGMKALPVIGSTESNFQLMQSAIGITVLGKMINKEEKEQPIGSSTHFAIIGSPLVGNEVIEQSKLVAPLSLFAWMCQQENITHIVPIGSKGILYKLNKLQPQLEAKDIKSDLNLIKTSGPATCFLIAYHQNIEDIIVKKSGSYFHRLCIKSR
ncbi:ATP-binding protein [Heyndrickxia sp. NPDC080065]|uniref:ATP-binding protein n=1 Tax=Heyndrickxia sp. NPDC080065 TaxID=3390568 RepID=UPI003D07264A